MSNNSKEESIVIIIYFTIFFITHMVLLKLFHFSTTMFNYWTTVGFISFQLFYLLLEYLSKEEGLLLKTLISLFLMYLFSLGTYNVYM